jgi:spore germination protein KC
MVRRVAALIMAAGVLLLTGCWSRRELTDVSFAGVVGFDWVDDQYLVTIAIHSPRQTSAGGEKAQPTARTVWTISEQAPSPDVAFAQLDQILPRALTLTHVRSIIFGEEMARRGIGPVMDFLLRSVEIRPTAWVGVTNGQAAEVLRAQPRQGVMTEGPLGYHEWTRDRSSITPARRLTDVAHILQEEGIDLTLPLFRRANKSSPNPERSQEEGALRPKPEDAEEIIYGGSGVFRGDKLVAWLTPRETRGHLWGINEVGHGIVSAPCPKPVANQRVVFRLRNSNGRTTLAMVNGKLQGTVSVRVVVDVNEITCDEPLVGEEDTNRLEQVLEARVREYINASVNISRREGSDMFGFGQSLFRRQPAMFLTRQAKWDKILADLPVTVEVDARVVRLGQSRHRFHWREAH